MKRGLAAAAFLSLIACAVWSYWTGGAVNLMLSPETGSQARLVRIQNYFDSWGAVAPLGYVALVTIEVVLAPIPGTVLYMPGGAIFGWALGGLLSLAGNVVGAGLACQIMRSLGRDYLNRYLEADSLKKFENILERRGLWIVFLLRVNPLTSSDLVSYAAGLTRIPIWKVLTGTLLGMAPLCLVQAYFAEELLTSFPRLVYPLILLGVAYGAYVCILIRRLVVRAGA